MKKIPIFNDRPIEKEWGPEDIEEDVRAINEQITKNAMKMKEFTIGGKPRLQKAFAEVLGVPIYKGYDKEFPYLFATKGEVDDGDIVQAEDKSDTHFDLPAQWDEAMSYARAFYGMEKEETYTKNQVDAIYLTGVFNVMGIDGLSAEIKRLKELGRLPHELLHTTGDVPKPEQPKEEKPPQTIPNYVSEFVDWLYINCYEITDIGKWQRWRNGEEDEQEIVRYGHIYTIGYLYNEFLHDPSWQQPKEEKPPLPESENDLPPIELVAVAVPEVASKEFWAFTKLYQLRQAYWNAHDGWRPDWKDADQFKYCIKYIDEKPIMDTAWGVRQFLAFPTLKQAKHFLKHHKALIEQARELL